MKIVSIEITSSELFGCVLDKNQLPSIFSIPLTEFDFRFFKKLGIDQNKDFLSAVFNKAGSLYVEKKVPQGLKRARKQQILSQVQTYFPFQENEAKLSFVFAKVQNNLFLKSAGISKPNIAEFETVLDNLQFTYDHISSWQIALKLGFEFFEKTKSSYQLILVKEQVLYYLCIDDQVLSSSISFSFKTLSDAPFAALKTKISKEKHPLFICCEPSLFSEFLCVLESGEKPSFEEKWNPFLLSLGSCVLAKDNQLNLATPRSYKFSLLFNDSLKFINLSVLAFSALIFATTTFLWLKQEYQIAKNIDSSNQIFITQNQLEQILSEQKKLNVELKNVPSSFSLAKILNLLAMQKDLNSSKNCHFQELDVRRLDHQNIKLRCVILFHQKEAMELFEKNLRAKKLSFKKITINPAIEYEITFKTNTLLF